MGALTEHLFDGVTLGNILVLSGCQSHLQCFDCLVREGVTVQTMNEICIA